MWTDTRENWIFDLVVNNLSLALTNVYYIYNILHNTCIDHMYAIAEKMGLTWNICNIYLSLSFSRKVIKRRNFGENIYYNVSCLPATPLSPFQTLEGLFELTQRPSRALNSPRALFLELQRIKDTVRRAVLGAEPSTRSITADANHDCAFVENALFYTDPWLCEKSTE